MKLSVVFVFSAICAVYANPIRNERNTSRKHANAAELREQYVLKDYYNLKDDTTFTPATYVYPAAPTLQSVVKPIIATLEVNNLQKYLNKFTSFYNRYYDSDTGKQASNWLFNTITEIIANSPSNSSVAAQRFHHAWKQSSIIVKFPGRQQGPITILGSHLDSVNWDEGGKPEENRAPGADDDGSGTVSMLEAFRALASQGFKPRNDVEFHWYSAEEAPVDDGSGEIAASYRERGVAVKGMMQYDMTAYVKPGTREIFGLMQDYTTDTLSTYVTTLAAQYNTIPAKSGETCGYGCSDHVSWNATGYPTVMPAEGIFKDTNPFLHTTNDTTSLPGFSWTHMLEFSKLAVAFAVELGNAHIRASV
ncbi:hypothetical protein NP233_g3910 [Leucocoprinus birnbaumii]|uniref:Peptide hydrolase n=1 Tax=Leucocoprinus birnbaumii TaxID=56174 RepID=A0AAD5VYC1_9AGAR|nr:hypothetical protein NP233_g3910 [Leucocoprinus birnbaumii]